MYYAKYSHYIVTIDTDDTNLIIYGPPDMKIIDSNYLRYTLIEPNYTIIAVHNIDGTPVQITPDIITYVYTTYEQAFSENFIKDKHWEKLNGTFSGHIREYYINGQIATEQYVVANSTSLSTEGHFYFWHSNGQLRVKSHLINGKKEGKFTAWDANGNISTDAFFVNDMLNGHYIQNTFEDGSTDTNYTNGKINGRYIERYPNGLLSIDTTYTNGIINGPYKKWHDNGLLSIDTNYTNGLINGRYIEWDTNGKLSNDTVFVDGKEIS